MNPDKSRITNRVKFLTDKKQQVYGFTVFTAVVILILTFGAIKPSIETIVRLRSEIKAKENTVDRLEEKINTINALAIQYQEFQDTAEDFSLIFPDNEDFSLYLANIESITEQSGLELRSISFARRSARETRFKLLTPVTVNLSVMGKRQNLIPYLQTLEGLPMYPEVKSVSFNLEVDDEGNNNFSVMMVIYGIRQQGFYE